MSWGRQGGPVHVLSYLLYGDKPEYQLELSYSVLTAMRHLRRSPSPVRIALVTDEANARPDLPVEHVIVSTAEFAAWTDGGRYLHMAQHRALAKALDCFGGKVVQVDTDTSFVEHPAKIFAKIGQGRSLMHTDEGPVGAQKRWRPFFEALGPSAVVAGYRVAARQPIYNAGVIGLDARDRALLEDADAVVRGLYAMHPVFDAEQVGVGTVLDARTRLSVCDREIAHHWGVERWFVHAQIRRLLDPPGREGFERLAGAERLPRIGFPEKSVIDRVAARWRAFRRGVGRHYAFAYLAYRSALRAVDTDPVCANVWARVALHALRFHGDDVRDGTSGALDRETIRRDFQELGGRALDRHGWIDADTKRGWDEYWAAPRDAA